VSWWIDPFLIQSVYTKSTIKQAHCSIEGLLYVSYMFIFLNLLRQFVETALEMQGLKNYGKKFCANYELRKSAVSA